MRTRLTFMRVEFHSFIDALSTTTLKVGLISDFRIDARNFTPEDFLQYAHCTGSSVVSTDTVRPCHFGAEYGDCISP